MNPSERNSATFIDVVYIKEECKLFVNILKKLNRNIETINLSANV
jgi:hypothetical protein